MRDPIIIDSPNLKVILRKDFHDKFEDQLRNITENTGVTYVDHTITQNYRETGQRVSSFCNQDVWHDVYWEKYWDDDSMEKACHAAIQKNNFAVVSWKIEQETSPCCEERLKVTQTNDGVTLLFKKKDNCTETLSFGWNTLKTNHLDTEYIFHLMAQLKPLRDYHWSVYNTL